MIAISDLRECGFDDMEGQAIGPWFHEWLRGERVIPGAEPVHQFLARALIGINTALDLPGRVMIVAHGGVFRSIRQAAGFTDTGPIRNAHPIRLTPPEDGFSWRHDSPPTGP
jgi:probable phosphoglycerate mutase